MNIKSVLPAFLLVCICGLSHLNAADNKTSAEKRTDQPGKSTASLDRTQVVLPDGIKPKENKAAEEGIRDVLRTLVNAAAIGDTFKVVEQFSAPDRDRIEPYTSKFIDDFKSLNKEFVNMWKTRFGGVFNMDRNVFGPQFFVIATGEIADPQALTSWPLNPTPQKEVPKEKGEKTSVLHRDYLSKGRDVAIVRLPASAGLPELKISFVHEAPDFWKIDIPDNIGGEALKKNLQEHFNAMTAGKQTWPPQSEEAYRQAAHHLLMAVYGIPMP